ncbi:MAG TPA: site-specific integrase, partial [Phycisphaerales bacterium]|nr:site-specific integrase [Phycisphaerales bacterium]
MTTQKSPRIPKYRLHAPSGLGVVRLNGRDIYLGTHGTKESRQEYGRLINEWLANNRLFVPNDDATGRPADLTVNELILSYLNFAKGYYVKNGEPTGEMHNVKDALRPVAELYGNTFAADFGPRALKAVRQAMIEADLCRNVINSRINRVRRMFKWAVENELVQPHILEGLRAVAPLLQGRSVARETKPVEPVREELIDPVLAAAPRQVAAMIRLQRLAGMRPSEVTSMRAADIDMTLKVWAYKPQTHKTEHHGRSRIIYLGPQAQEVVKQFLTGNPTVYLFDPRQVVAEYRQRIREEAKCPRAEDKLSRRRKPPRRAPHEKYTRNSYARAIVKACDRAFPPPQELLADKPTKEQWQQLRQWRRDHRFAPNQR